MDIFGAFLNILRIILGLVLVLFIPGFALSWALFPKKGQMPLITRIALSSVLSMSSVMLIVIFMDMILGIDSTPLNIVIIILVTTAIALAVWRIEVFLSGRKIQETIAARTPRWVTNLKSPINHLYLKVSSFFKRT